MLLDTGKVIIPNWFEKKHLEELTGTKLTRKKFEEFRICVSHHSPLGDRVSEMILEAFYEWQDDNK